MKVVKYCANGNDFLLYNAFETKALEYARLAPKLCARHNGIGADGFVALKPSKQAHIAYEWEFYNADGSKAEMCGNASRCVGNFAYLEGLAPREHKFLSLAGIISVEVDSINPYIVESALGEYTFIKDVRESSPWGEQWALINTGVPHLVCITKTLGNIQKGEHKALLHTLRIKYNANVNVVFVSDRQTLQYITYERGVEDITLACGTGAAAVMAQAYRLGLVESSAKVLPPSKEALEVRIDSQNITYLKGKVSRIAVCEISENFIQTIF